MHASLSVSHIIRLFLVLITFSSSCRQGQNRCLERYSRIYVHECRSHETCGMVAAHLLLCVESMTVEPAQDVTDPHTRRLKHSPSYTWWCGGIGCSVSDPNEPGHYMKIICGKGTHGSDTYCRGQKMMEGAALARFCRLPSSSCLSGSSDVEIRRIR